jgi:uncharacterized membrane protein YidH (DUF202 family)
VSPEKNPDPAAGASPERTRLAWRRTVLAGTAVALLGVRLAAVRGSVAGALFGAVTLAGWVVVLVLTYRRIRQLAAGEPVPVGRVLPLAAAAAVAYAVAGTGLVLATRS